MAGRSDFYSSKFPRHLKRMLALMGADQPDQRKLWIDAHAAHKRFKMRQNSSPTATRDPVVEAAVAAME